MNANHLDTLECRSSAVRETALFERFGERLAAAAAALPGLSAHLAGHDLAAIEDRDALARLPVLRKDVLMAAQGEQPPFGGFVDASRLAGSRVFASPGPVFEAQRPGIDPWACARALQAAGIRPGMTVHNAFSYHLTPGGFILDEGARALGCTVFPAGVGNTEAQVAAIRQLRPEAYTGTPDYLRTLLDHAGDEALSLRLALVSGGALFPAMREAYRASGVQVLQCYATADAGVIAYESMTPGRVGDEGGFVVHPGMIVSEGLIVEICQPGSGEPVAPGERGEIVVTHLDPLAPDGSVPRAVSPLVRFATGDLSAVLEGESPCGRTNTRLAGWLGRADQRTKVRGMFVDPVQVQRVRAEHAEVARLRLVVTRDGTGDTMTLRATLNGPADADAIRSALAGSLERACGLRGHVEIVDTLPADGVVVEDARDYDEHGT